MKAERKKANRNAESGEVVKFDEAGMPDRVSQVTFFQPTNNKTRRAKCISSQK